MTRLYFQGLQLLVIICIFTLGACQNDIEFEPVLGVYPNCTDGKQNQDETGIDCGGICGDCFIAPCQEKLTTNIIEVDDNKSSVTDVTPNFMYERYRLEVNTNNTSLKIVFPESSSPKEGGIYELQQSPFPSQTSDKKYAYLEVYTYSFNPSYKSTSGQMYVRLKDGVMIIEFCHVKNMNQYYNHVYLTGKIEYKLP